MYVAAEPVDAENLARFERVLGQDLKMPVEFTPAPADQPRRDLFLLDWRRDQPPFDQLGDTMAAVAGNLRFNRGLSSHGSRGGLVDDILAEYSDRSAALVVTPCGAGTLAVLNTDLTASNLRIPGLRPPGGRTVRQAFGSNQLCRRHPMRRAAGCLSPGRFRNGPGTEDRRPTGKRAKHRRLSDESTGTLWRADAVGSAGVYQVKRGDNTVFAIAAAAPATESDLQSIDPATLTTRLAAGRRVAYQTADDLPTKDQAWAWLLVGCTACLICEIGLLKLFRT